MCTTKNLLHVIHIRRRMKERDTATGVEDKMATRNDYRSREDDHATYFSLLILTQAVYETVTNIAIWFDFV